MEERLKHYMDKLAYETDAFDLKVAIDGEEKMVVVDARSSEAFRREHIPGAINIPHEQMNPGTTGEIDPCALIVVYCDGVGCNASTKGALQLTRLGFRVKELIGGLEWWKREGYTVESVSEMDSRETMV